MEKPNLKLGSSLHPRPFDFAGLQDSSGDATTWAGWGGVGWGEGVGVREHLGGAGLGGFLRVVLRINCFWLA